MYTQIRLTLQVRTGLVKNVEVLMHNMTARSQHTFMITARSRYTRKTWRVSSRVCLTKVSLNLGLDTHGRG